MVYRLDENEIWFPDPKLAEDDGLLAVGGDLSPGRLLLAYKNGIFPWYADDSPILWYSPHERFVLFPRKVKISASMRQLIRRNKYPVTVNKQFAHVVEACATAKRKGEEGTWITAGMRAAYQELHHLGWANSLEVWDHSQLAGGLYGILINGVFCGESMFSTQSNASKLALITLCQNTNIRMIDCQMHTPHLERMGAEPISRERYMEILTAAQT